jgi:alkylation response protein AidB-like acyl-CoA dehydrogenase
VDTRDTPEQAELRRAARQLARELGPVTVAGLDDSERRKRLTAAVRDAGWLELRDDGGDGTPLAGGVEAAIVADALGAAVADVAFSGPILGGDLARRTGCGAADGSVAALSPALIEAAVVTGPVTTTSLCTVDGMAEGADAAYVLVPDGRGFRLAAADLDREAGDGPEGADLTRAVGQVTAGAAVREVPDQRRRLTDDDLVAWSALGLALTSADLVGVMRGVLEITVAYAAERKQYGVPVGSFQAVQHLLAEAHCLMEGSLSVALHASWAVDNLAPEEARAAGRVAKAYCSRAARTVCETAVQVHGGIGNTWECMVHVYLRRALLSAQWFGDDGEQLRRLQGERLGIDQRPGVANGLS